MFFFKQKTAYAMRISDWSSDVFSSDLFDMAHPLAADLRHSDFDTALFEDDALVLHALVLAEQEFIVLDRTEDAGAEQAVTFRLERARTDESRRGNEGVRTCRDRWSAIRQTQKITKLNRTNIQKR